MTLSLELPRQVAATITANGALVAGKHTPVDATTASITVTLPAWANPGASLSVEKIDSTAHAVTVSGTIRGVTTTTVLSLQHSSITFTAEASGTSWTPTAGRLSEASVSATYVSFGTTAPDHTVTTVWVDTSAVPQVVKGWDGTSWAAIGGSGGGGNDPAFQYTQATATAQWTISHAFGRRPDVDIYLTTGEHVITDVTASATQVVITFPTPTAGYAVLT